MRALRASSRATYVILALALAAGACRRAKPNAAPGAVSAATDPARARQDSIDRALAARRDSMDRALAAAQAREDSLARAREAERIANERRAQERTAGDVASVIGAAVFFEYDAAELSEQARTALASKAQLLQMHRNIRIRITGHTDSRGADEYNLALGQRRAAAAKRYLVQLGVADDRIELVSMGEEHPAALGEDESAWLQNRRAEFTIIGDGREPNP